MKVERWNRVHATALLVVSSVLVMGCERPDGGGHVQEAASPGRPAGTHEEEDEHHDEGVVELDAETVARVGIRTAIVETRTLPREIETTGSVDFDQDRLVHVGARIGGRVHEVRTTLGETVGVGQPLVVIDSIELGRAKADYLESRAELDLARRTLEREEGLFAENISAERDVLEARAAFQRASADFRAIEQELHLYGLAEQQIESIRYDDPQAALFSVASPIGGKVVDKHVTRGEMVTPERTLLTLADLSRVWIWIDVYERDLQHVHPDDDVEVQVDAYPDLAYQGTVAYVSDQVDVDTRAVRARVDVDNRERTLKPGMFARVRLTDPHASTVEGLAEQTLTVPDSALQRDGEETIVFVEIGAGRFERREVRVGRRSGGHAEILGGVPAGERVVVEGGFLLKSEVSKGTMGGGHEH